MKCKTIKYFWFVLVIILLIFALSGCDGGGGGGDDDPYNPSDYPSTYPNAKIIFVTHTIDTGDLSDWMVECQHLTGLVAADCICQQHAERWGNLSGTYKAWLSDSTTSASSRLTHSDTPYVNRRGEQIAANWDELTAGTLQCDDIMNYDEGGDYMSTQFHLVWTGTDRFGEIMDPSKTCDDWNSGNAWDGGYTGSATVDEYYDNKDGCWTEWGWRDCDGWNRLYCVEQ